MTPRHPRPAAAVLVALALLAGVTAFLLHESGPVSAIPTEAAAPVTAAAPDEVDHPRPSEMDLALVSRTYNAGDDNWTIVAEATLSSNRICLPIAFNCIVGDAEKPANASLTELKCQSPLWNHLLVFRDHCLKQVFFAGHDQKFEFTWTTDPGVNSGTVDLAVEFGRGFLPKIFQRLASASLTVDLDVALDVTKSCPTEVDSGAALECTITVAYPQDPPPAGPTITGIEVVDTPDAVLSGLLAGATLTKSGGAGAWNCVGTTCDSGSLAPGESATFAFAATAATTATGGSGANTATVTWTGPSPGGPIEASDEVVVVGNGDTRLELEKATTATQATPGAPISWTVTLTNAGPLDATGVVLTDVAPAEVTGLTLTYASGVGTWSCSGLQCTTASMPVGAATFTAAGTVAAGAAPDSTVVNEVDVAWENDILGPDFPITAGSAVPVVAGSTTTSIPGATTPTTVPARGPAPEGRGGNPISFAG